MSRTATPFVLLGLLALAGGGAARASVELELVAAGFALPTAVVSAGDGTGRLFVAEKQGRVWVLEPGSGAPALFLDLSDRTFSAGGNGLLGLAFHPDHRRNGFLYAHYVDLDERQKISRFRVAPNDPRRARASSERVVFAFEQPPGGHKGGDIAFGPDGFLYVASGDGSSGGDPENNAQNLGSQLGKILRLDVDVPSDPIPPGNPFLGEPGARPEIWAYGLRNPWRISFDRRTGDLFIADVGELRREEIDWQPAASGGGENYGWRRMEGSECFEPATDCGAESLVAPILEYGHDLGCSVTGGYRYRGRRAPTLEGHYVFGDFCSGTIWGAAPNRRGVWVSRVLAESGLSIVTFGQGEDGELYVADFAGGDVYRLISRELFASGFESGNLRGWKRRGPVRVIEPGLGGSGFALAAEARRGVEAAVGRRLERPASRLAVGFDLDLSRLDLGGGAAIVAAWSDGRRSPLRVVAEQISDRRYRVALEVEDAVAGQRRIGSFRVAARRPFRLQVKWRAASASDAADGVVRLLANGRQRAAARNVADGWQVRAVEVGLPAGAPGGSGGRLVLDGFVIDG